MVILALSNEDDNLRFFMHPELNKIVQERHWTYIESLLLDFRERADLDRDSLFQQISDLSVGPLVTAEAGSDISDYPVLLDLRSRFKKL